MTDEEDHAYQKARAREILWLQQRLEVLCLEERHYYERHPQPYVNWWETYRKGKDSTMLQFVAETAVKKANTKAARPDGIWTYERL